MLQAIKLDPDFADPYIVLANYRLMDVIFTRNLLPEDLDGYLNDIEELLMKGLSLDSSNAEG